MKVSVESVLQALRSELQPMALQRQILDPVEALGRVTSKPIYASQAHPPQPVSAMDGYAIAGQFERYVY